MERQFDYTLSRVLCIPHGSWSNTISIVLCVFECLCVSVWLIKTFADAAAVTTTLNVEFRVPSIFDELYIRFAREICNNIIWCYDLSVILLSVWSLLVVFVVSGYRTRSLSLSPRLFYVSISLTLDESLNNGGNVLVSKAHQHTFHLHCKCLRRQRQTFLALFAYRFPRQIVSLSFYVLHTVLCCIWV